VRPTASQRGWRTVVHRQRDTYFLAAGSSLTGVSGRADDVLAGAVIAAVSWLAIVTTRSRGRWLGDRRHTWRVAVGAVLIGSLADVVLVPSTTLLGPALLATWFAVTATRRREAVGGWLVAATALGLTVATLAAPSAVGAWVQRDDGGVARTAAVGIAMIVAGVTVWHRAGPHVEPRPGGPHHDPGPPSF
jgi:hypothetical protein